MSFNSSNSEIMFYTLDGRESSTADFKGSILIMDIITTWDNSSMLLIQNQRKLPQLLKDKNVVLIAVAMQRNKGGMLDIFRSEMDMTFPLYKAGPELLQGVTPYGYVEEVPIILIMDQNGHLLKSYKGIIKNTQLLKEIKRHNK